MTREEAIETCLRLKYLYTMMLDNEDDHASRILLENIENKWGDRRKIIRTWYDMGEAAFPFEIEIAINSNEMITYSFNNVEELVDTACIL